MGSGEREERLLRDVFEEGHRATRERTPPFAALWSRAAAGGGAAARRARGYRAAVAVLAAAVVAVALLVGLRRTGRRAASERERVAAAAAAISQWQAPLDFLLETPGRRWLDTTPRWRIESAADPAQPERHSGEEVTQ